MRSDFFGDGKPDSMPADEPVDSEVSDKPIGVRFREDDLVSSEKPNRFFQRQEKSSCQSEGDKTAAEFKIIHAKMFDIVCDSVRFALLERKFEKGKLVLALDSKDRSTPLMYFLQVGDELMAYKYLGHGTTVRVPSSVCGKPVRYMHSKFLQCSGVKFIADNFNLENLLTVTPSSIKESLKGVRSVILPESLIMLPPKLFRRCIALKEITVPASVRTVAVDTFDGCCLKSLYFEGQCPANLCYNTGLLNGVNVLFKEQNASTFVGGET